MKKVVIALLTLVVITILVLVSIPTFFSDDIEALVKREINRELDAKVEFSDLSLSAFRAFPNLALAVDNLSIVNNTPDADTLAQLDRLDITLGLGGLLGGKQDIRSVVLDRPKLTFIIDENEKPNWEILPQTSEQSDTSSGEVNLVISSYAIQDATVRYFNKPKNTELTVTGLNHIGSGDFTSENFLLNTVTNATGISYANEGVTYIQEAVLDAVIDLDMNLTEKRYTLKDNTLKLNEIELQLSGWVQEILDGYNTSLVFNAPEAKIEDVLSILPLFYTETYSELNGSGLVVLKGNMDGEYRQGEIPRFTASASIKQGSFRYASLPTPVEAIEMDLTVENKGNTPDDVLTRLDRLNFRIKNKPFSARMVLTKPISDMQVDGAMKGSLSMSDIRTALPLTDDTQLSGDISTDLKINGSLKALEENQPQRFSSSGTLQLANLQYASADLPEDVKVNQANMTFSSTQARLNNLDATIGKSDLKATGELQNLFGYLMANQPLYGKLNLQSNSFDMNPWIEGESETVEPPRLPDNIEFLLGVTAATVEVDQLNMTDVRGDIILKDGKLSLNELTGNTLNGKLVATGSYFYPDDGKPEMDFALNLDKMSIPALYKNIMTVQQLMPFASYMGGDISGQVTLNTPLDNTFMPEWAQLLSQGKLIVPKVNVKDFAPFNKLSEALNLSRLKDPSLSNLRPSYYIKDGRFVLEPMRFAVGDYNIEASGSNGLDKSLDYLFKVTLPASELKQSSNTEIAGLLNTDINLLGTAPVTVDMKVSGSPESPTVKPVGVNIVQNIADPVKDKIRQEQEKAKQKLEEQINKDLQKKKEDLKNSVGKKLKGLFGGGKK